MKDQEKSDCAGAEIITLFLLLLLRNSFSIIWNITNYGCQAEARGMNYEPDFYVIQNGDFSGSTLYTFNWIRSRKI